MFNNANYSLLLDKMVDENTCVCGKEFGHQGWLVCIIIEPEASMLVNDYLSEDSKDGKLTP